MDYETIKTEVEGAVGIITLNRPDSLNAFNAQMRADFVAAAAEMEANDAVRAVVLTGAGRGFCAGADLKETGGTRDKTVTEILIEEYKPGILAIANSDKTYIAAVAGPASGIGAAYAQACDMMIMGEGTMGVAFFYGSISPITHVHVIQVAMTVLTAFMKRRVRVAAAHPRTIEEKNSHHVHYNPCTRY